MQAPPIAQEGSPSPELDPERDLYGALFFHGERFRRLRRYEALHWNGCHAQIDGRDDTWFGSFQPQTLELGDPGARDAAVHAIQACLPDREVLPVGVEEIEFHRALPKGTIRLIARERSRSEGSYLYDLALFDVEGGLLECWRGLTLRALEAVRARDAWVPGLLGPHLEEIANTVVPGLELCGAFVAGGGREASERAFAIARGERAPLRHRSDGKPLLAGVAFASATHAVGLTLAIVAAAPVACDLEAAAGRSAADWADLLDGERLATAHGIAALLAEPFDHAATRVWGIVECLRKLGCARETPILLEGSAGGDSITLAAGRFVAISWRGALRGASTPVVATLLAGERQPTNGDAKPGGARASHG